MKIQKTKIRDEQNIDQLYLKLFQKRDACSVPASK